MRKNMIISVFLLLLLALVGCASKNDVKVYEDTEDGSISHTEVSVTAIILNINLEQNIVQFKDCRTGVEHSLLYHGGVKVTNSRGRNVGLNDLGVGSVVDMVYYEDTAKLVSVIENKSSSTITNVKKFSANKENKKATYKGISCNMSEHVVAINHDGRIFDVSEVSTEDKVTLHMFGQKLVAVVIDEGHGYVRLSNQDTYIGGRVEIGYDVIVPVTDNMLLTVREGEYTLRINNRGYSQAKDIVVKKDTETLVDLGDIAIPTGTVVFDIEPSGATIYVGKQELSGHAYTDIYGSYTIRVVAEGYKTYKGSFKIDDTVKSIDINLTEIESTTEDDTTETTDDKTTEKTTSSSTEKPTPTDADKTTTEQSESTSTATTEDGGSGSSEEGVETNNIITVNTPALAGVYVDGDYVGVAPISFTKVTGPHTITLYRSGYLIKSYTIYAEDNGKDDVYNFAELTTLLDLIE